MQGGFTPLLFVARNGDVVSAKILLAAGANVNVAAAVGTTALVVAVHSGRAAIARLLLDNGADPNNAGAGYTALHIAVRRDDRELVQTLLVRGANPNVLLMKATPVRRQSIVDIGLHYSLVCATPFWMAARFGDSEMMRLLAAYGADPSFVKSDGTTSVMAPVLAFTIPGVVGSESRRLEALKVALDFGGDVNASNEAGETALHGAAKLGYNGVVQFLVEKGAQLDRKNKSGRTALGMTGPCHITPSSMRPIAGRPGAIGCVERTSTSGTAPKARRDRMTTVATKKTVRDSNSSEVGDPNGSGDLQVVDSTRLKSPTLFIDRTAAVGGPIVQQQIRSILRVRTH